MVKLKYFVRVDGAIRTVYGFTNKKKAIKFNKNINQNIGHGFTDFGTLTDGFLEFAYSKQVYGEIIDMSKE